MKFSFVLFLLLDIPHLKGQQRIEEFEQFLLRLTFPSFYNNYNKSCCKLYPGGCYKLLDSAGFTCGLLKGRVTTTEKDGWIEFKISNVRYVDGGFYRCMVLGTQNHIYSDYYVEVSEVSGHNIPLLATTVKAPSSSTTPPHSTGPDVAQDRSDSPRVPWTFGLPLAVIVSITVMLLITSVIGVVWCRVKAKRKQTNKYGETLCESLKQEAPEISGIVYTTVDFIAHEKPTTEVYANLRMHKTQVIAPDSTWSAEPDWMVEYSTLAIHQQ
ncbi:uncharacterized protein LOC117542044 isoform X1 [Gymnodraco acuticeps]|uniref:Uncharacterized protein LOC117542044 isoform X1 n=2 Tax=Gymnodraco acuticeps TaxID=8218 RepID=A0A6P8TMK4_GYMAC|nr:uncharacterized protein LOC117542044 isoform X1 [Gymnodraco acuticeps]